MGSFSPATVEKILAGVDSRGIFQPFRSLPIEFRADWALYYAPLRSLHFDGDIDVTNEWEALGFPQPVKTETGLADNKQPLGPALLWSPFYYTAHTYVYLVT